MDQYRLAIDEAISDFTNVYEIGEEIVADFRKFLLTAGEKHLSDMPTSSTKRTRIRRKNGYNCFISAQFDEHRKQNQGTRVGNSQELMGIFAKKWSSLPSEEKKKFEEKASQDNENLKQLNYYNKKNKKPMTGYNLYYKECNETLKAEASELGIKPMKHVGATWRALSEEVQQSYRDRAAKLHDPNFEPEN